MNARTLPHFDMQAPAAHYAAVQGLCPGVSAEESSLLLNGATVSTNDPEVIAWAASLPKAAPIKALSPVLMALNCATDRADVHLALEQIFRAQMAAGFTGNLPGCERTAEGAYILAEDKAYIEVLEALDQPAAFEVFAEVIKASTCPLVAKLRRHMSDAYVQNNIEQVCEAVGVVE
jgi:hypothetical protein